MFSPFSFRPNSFQLTSLQLCSISALYEIVSLVLFATRIGLLLIHSVACIKKSLAFHSYVCQYLLNSTKAYTSAVCNLAEPLTPLLCCSSTSVRWRPCWYPSLVVYKHRTSGPTPKFLASGSCVYITAVTTGYNRTKSEATPSDRW